MRIELEDGGWLEGKVVLKENHCGSICHTCECPPTWMAYYHTYKSDGTRVMLTSFGISAEPNDVEGAQKKLESHLLNFAKIKNDYFKKRSLG